MCDLQEQFQVAIRFREEGNLIKAQACLEELVARHSSSAAAFVVLGDVYWSRNLLDNAVEAFREATRLAPASEDASLALFHALWDNGLEEDAFQEWKRFVSEYQSEEYSRLIKELKQ